MLKKVLQEYLTQCMINSTPSARLIEIVFVITLKQYTLTGLAVTDNWFILCVLYSFLQILREGKEKRKGPRKYRRGKEGEVC